MKTSLFLTLLILVSIPCIGQQTIEQEVKQLFEAQLEKGNIKSAILHVYSESKDIDLQLAESNPDSGDHVNINSPFYTASITKMLTATAIGILKDREKLNFEDKIAQHLPEELIDRLHVLDDKEYSEEITIAQLLQHTSGLPDYFTGTTMDGSPNVINQLLVNTDKTWSPQEIIQFTKDKMKPHFAPGQGYYYSDTEYVLLALIIEEVSGMSLERFFQQYIFEPLEMHSSYINLKSAPTNSESAMAGFYVGDIELSSIKSLSADWGGGGLVSTTQDLINFLKGLNEDLILKKETRLAMQNWIAETEGTEYGFGIRKISFQEHLNSDTDLQVLGHTGSTASFLWYCPQVDTYIAGTLNQLEASKSTPGFVYDVLKTIERN
ncbi:serine hydrolase domain-containing protein [Salinimicrobium sp. HB62]|uniref:serine hydrolase domain-containing protein n=1 Tax=Salinimicrobium sp. HB62 TaxID=3077781 RepID=UPI002D78F0C5|nr:serine hydrolase domain-containing protein [Salinimicrobium sp. HB62]